MDKFSECCSARPVYWTDLDGINDLGICSKCGEHASFYVDGEKTREFEEAELRIIERLKNENAAD